MTPLSANQCLVSTRIPSLTCGIWPKRREASILLTVSPTNCWTMLSVTATWKQATPPCSRDPRCRGIEPGEFYYEYHDGRAVHPVGFCKDQDGHHLPDFP